MLKYRSPRERLELDMQLNGNLNALLRERYSFIFSRMPSDSRVLDVGAGHALSPIYLKNFNLVLTDIAYNASLSAVASGDLLPFRD